MAWFRLDDKFHSHAKVLAAGNAAIGLYVRCGTWSCDQRTEGKIPRHVARNFGTAKEATALVECRLWAEAGDDYMMPDFLEFNPSNEEVDAKRAARAAAGSKGGQAKAKQTLSKAVAIASPNADDCLVPGVANACPLPDPIPKNHSPLPPADDSSLRRQQVVGEYLRIARERNTTPIRSQQAFDTHMRKQAEDNPDLNRWCALFPTAPPDAVAGWLHGDKGSMRYYPRVDELAPVTELRKDKTA